MNEQLWQKFKNYYLHNEETGTSLDISRMNFPENFFGTMRDKMNAAFDNMDRIEAGELINVDEKRMVGHYWLRNPALAAKVVDSKANKPEGAIKKDIETTLARLKSFAADVHSGKIAPPCGGLYKHLLVVGIGGSALGPQFVSKALRSSSDKMDSYFFDNTDPDGMTGVLGSISDLSRTLVVVISKSGDTKETSNGMLVVQDAWKTAGLDFAKNMVAVTGEGSRLDKIAVKQGWLERFPMWDWVGGRTSELGVVGLLPAALQGANVDEMLRGAREMDNLTRSRDVLKNPAAVLSLMWHFAGEGKGSREMVILPYNDRLELFSKYLQQLVMESLGKELDLHQRVVNQGLTVFGNKGSTDQHAYVQQLREGLSNFFVVFLEVLKDKSHKSTISGKENQLPAGYSADALEVEPGIRSGDYLSGFYLGTRTALHEKGRQSMTITLDEVNEYMVGALIALFERSVGLYASLININAYHQPGVQAGKLAAQAVLDLQLKAVECLARVAKPLTVEQIAAEIKSPDSVETLYKLMQRLSANSRVKCVKGASPFENKYSV